MRSPLNIRGALVAPQLADAPRGGALLAGLRERGVDVTEVTFQEFSSAAETESPQGVLAVAEIPDRSLDTLGLPPVARLVVLDAVQDPGNVGTILRTSAALGAGAVLALPGTVDLWNAKVVRSSMGAAFHLPSLSITWPELELFRHREGMTLWGADAAGTPVDQLSVPARLAVVVGNEGAGLSDDARRHADALASLPIDRAVESLNVAVATGILLYQVRP